MTSTDTFVINWSTLLPQSINCLILVLALTLLIGLIVRWARRSKATKAQLDRIETKLDQLAKN